MSYTQDVTAVKGPVVTLEDSEAKVGYMRGKAFVPNPSKDGMCGISSVGSCNTIILILGIILWAVGASNGNASMILAGKVLFGLSIVPVGCGCIVLPILFCFGAGPFSRNVGRVRV